MAIVCDICGGKLMGRPGGVFECGSCGMEYDIAWAKEKAQGIKGAVPQKKLAEAKRIEAECDEYDPEEGSLADYVNDAFGGDWQIFEDNWPDD